MNLSLFNNLLHFENAKTSQNISQYTEKLDSALVIELYNKIKNSSYGYTEEFNPIIVYYKYKIGPIGLHPVKWQTSGPPSEVGIGRAKLWSLLYSKNKKEKIDTENAVYAVLETIEKIEFALKKKLILPDQIKPYTGEKLYILYRSIAYHAQLEFRNNKKAFRRKPSTFKKLNCVFKSIYKTPAIERLKVIRKSIKQDNN